MDENNPGIVQVLLYVVQQWTQPPLFHHLIVFLPPAIIQDDSVHQNKLVCHSSLQNPEKLSKFGGFNCIHIEHVSFDKHAISLQVTSKSDMNLWG
jgi:hypothetical protein